MEIITRRIELFVKVVTKKRKEKNNNNTLIQNQQPKIDKININRNNDPNVSTYENHAQIVIGPGVVVKLITCSKC